MPLSLRQAIAMAFVFAVTRSRSAGAQVRWDVGAELGVMQRLTTGRDLTVPGPTPGPMGELHAHVALVPMIRIGAYVSQDISPTPGLPAHEITEAGLRAKLSPPLFSGPWRSWIFLGLGYARAYAPSHVAPVASSGPAAEAFEAGAGGGILDLPIGLGMGYRLRRPWEIFAELGGRIGLAFFGDLYRRTEGEPYGGQDSFAVSLSVGVNWDE